MFGHLAHILQRLGVFGVEIGNVVQVGVAFPVDQLGGGGRAHLSLKLVAWGACQMHNPTGAAVRGVAGVPFLHVQRVGMLGSGGVNLVVDALKVGDAQRVLGLGQIPRIQIAFCEAASVKSVPVRLVAVIRQ